MKIIFKYIISGGTAAFVDLSILHFLDSLGMHYLLSVNIAFLIAFLVSFCLQKYWTFHDAEYRKVHHQLSVYFIVSVLNFFLNNLLVHAFLVTDIIPNILFFREVVIAQFLASALIAIESFVVYRFVIFKKDVNYKKNSRGSKPKILIITQKIDINDSYFSFFHDWLERFAQRSEKLTVLALEVGEYRMPENVMVYALSKGKKLKTVWQIWKYSIKERKNYDFVFCHMSPIFLISGWMIWELLDKSIGLWYVHRNVDLKLRMAHTMADIVFTASKESFNIKSNKVKYLGQAVDIQKFSKPENLQTRDKGKLKILTVGRITRIKNLVTLIDAVNVLIKNNIKVDLSIVGETVTKDDIDYKEELEKQIVKNNLDGNISFVGSVPNKDLPKYYWQNDIFINLSPTGGLDKAVLEAMASKTVVIVSNKAFENYLGEYSNLLIANEGDSKDFANKIETIYRHGDYDQITSVLRKSIEDKSNLNILIDNIFRNINELNNELKH